MTEERIIVKEVIKEVVKEVPGPHRVTHKVIYKDNPAPKAPLVRPMGAR